MTTTSITTCLLVSCLGIPSIALAQDADTTRPLDERIDPSRITESPAPPLPDTIVQPLPARHRIARSAEEVPLDPQQFEAARRAIEDGLAYIASQQSPDGSWMNRAETAPTDAPKEPAPVGVAVSALAIKSLSQSGSSGSHLDRGLEFILASTGTPRGFALGPEGRLGTYVASAVGSALASIEDPAVQDRLQASIEWLKQAQWDDGEGLKKDQDWYGGVGYGNRGRPDLSNTQMMLEALHDAGVSPDDPAVQRALQFVSRTQNLTATNKAEWALNGSNDGGFIYTPANGGESMANEYLGEGRRGELLPEGQPRSLRSYGSMTYVGFKSLLYAGLTSDDPRVRAAFDWIRNNWTFAENPGLGRQGWFYYLHAMSRALNAARQETVTTPDGETHRWREELIDTLVAAQQPDGSWSNAEPRWMEDEPVLATIYATLSLQEALKPMKGEE